MKHKENSFAILFRYAQGQMPKFILSIVLSVVSITSGLFPFYCMAQIVEALVLDTLDAQVLGHWCLLALIGYALKVLMFSLSTGLSHTVAFNGVAALRHRVTDRFLHASMGEVQKYSIGQIKSVVVDKIEQIEPPLAHLIPEGAGHLVLPVISLIALAMIHWKIALASLVTVPAALVCMGLTFQISGKNFTRYDEANSYMNSTIVEYIEGIEVIKAFGRAGISYQKYASAISDYRTFVLKWMNSTWVTMKLAFALFPSTLLGTLPMSLILVSQGTVSISEVALAVMLSMSMVSSLARLEVFSENLNHMQNNLEDLQKYMTLPQLSEPASRVKIPDHTIQMEEVHFGYSAQEEVLHGIDLTIPQGKFTALVGPSGSGKSTIARLIARFWDVDTGKITIGGCDLRQIPLSQLSDTVSFVTQDNFLFRCSLMENIRMGNPKATDEQVREAARAAQCEEFILKLPQGYDTEANEAGKRLSGGEKQRIAIARMILKDAPVIILDEATAFTDPENEEKIQQSLAGLTEGKTLLVIAHRLSTIRKADNIVVLDRGNIVAQGTQQQLLENCPLYARMWEAHIGARQWAVSSNENEETVRKEEEAHVQNC